MTRFFTSDGKRAGHYAVHEITCGVGGRGFLVHRIGTGRSYHVRIGRPEDTDCECIGWLRWGHCVHIDTLLKLEIP